METGKESAQEFLNMVIAGNIDDGAF